VALSFGFLAALLVEANSFQAIGRSWPGFWIFFIRVFGVMAPVAYLSAVVFELSIYGVWGAVIAGNVIASVTGYFWINRALNKEEPAEKENESGGTQLGDDDDVVYAK
jgi:Na+-driven multidrug efflux pump